MREYLFNETACRECPPQHKPSDAKSKCDRISIEFVNFSNIHAIVTVVFATTGIIMTVFIIAVYIKHSEAPAIKASARELCFILLTGVFIAYAIPFLLLLKPNLIVCAAQKLSIGMAFSLMYSALLVKTNRIARIFDSSNVKAARPMFISPSSQVRSLFLKQFLKLHFVRIWVIDIMFFTFLTGAIKMSLFRFFSLRQRLYGTSNF